MLKDWKYEAMQFRDIDLAAQKAAEEQIKRDERNKRRRERDQSMRDLGLKKVKGALGGTYWE